jgi:hypothetical protein
MRVLLVGLAGLLLAGCEQMAAQIGGVLINGARNYREPTKPFCEKWPEEEECKLRAAGYQKADATFEDFTRDRDECAKNSGTRESACLATKGWTRYDPTGRSPSF